MLPSFFFRRHVDGAVKKRSPPPLLLLLLAAVFGALLGGFSVHFFSGRAMAERRDAQQRITKRAAGVAEALVAGSSGLLAADAVAAGGSRAAAAAVPLHRSAAASPPEVHNDAAAIGDSRAAAPPLRDRAAAPPEVRDDGGGVGRRLGEPGVFPRARPRVVHNFLFAATGCQDKAAYVRQFDGKAVVVEVGAFHGEEIPPFKGLVERLWTFEPSSSKLDLIRGAIRAAEMDSVVTLRPVAASDVDGEATLQMAKAEGTQQDSLGEIGFMCALLARRGRPAPAAYTPPRPRLNTHTCTAPPLPPFPRATRVTSQDQGQPDASQRDGADGAARHGDQRARAPAQNRHAGPRAEGTQGR